MENKNQIIEKLKSQNSENDFQSLIRMAKEGKENFQSEDWRLYYDNENDLHHLMGIFQKEEVEEILKSDLKISQTTFSIESYFDPYGDGKSDKKLFKRKFYNTKLSGDSLKKIHVVINKNRNYYSTTFLKIKPYKKTQILEDTKLFLYL